MPPSASPARASSSAVASMLRASFASSESRDVIRSVGSNVVSRRTYPVEIGSQHVELPVVSLSQQLALALLITVDMGVEFMRRAGEELAELLKPYDVDIVATVATMGIPVA